MKYYGFIITLICLLAVPALAEQQPPSPLSYTARGLDQKEKDPHKKDPLGRQGGMQHRTLKFDKDTKDENAAPSEDELAAERVWKKYRALAAGQYEEEAETPVDKTAPAKQKPKTLSMPKDSAEKPEEISPSSGLTTILHEYKQNKAQRSQMRMITITPDSSARTLDRSLKSTDNPASADDTKTEKSGS